MLKKVLYKLVISSGFTTKVKNQNLYTLNNYKIKFYEYDIGCQFIDYVLFMSRKHEIKLNFKLLQILNVIFNYIK